MRDAFSIRRASPRDAPAIADFNNAMALETEGRILSAEVVLAGVSRLLQTPALGFYLIAESDDKPIACLMVTHEWSDWRNGLFWWIQSVYVQAGWRRCGVYRSLYAFVRELALSEACVCGFRLYAEEDNAAAHATYLALGMARTGYRVYEEIKPPAQERALASDVLR